MYCHLCKYTFCSARLLFAGGLSGFELEPASLSFPSFEIHSVVMNDDVLFKLGYFHN
jgi:hypothetical protein